MTCTLPTNQATRVRALFWTRTETLYLLPTVTDENPAVSLSLGSGGHCPIRIHDDDAIAKVHCFVVYTRDAITLRRFKRHPVSINNVKMVEGEIELSVHNVITLSEDCELVVCDERLSPQPEITVVDLGAFVRRAMELYKDKSAAARGVDVRRKTFADWIATNRFGSAFTVTLVLGVALGAGYAFQSPSTADESSMMRPAAATSLESSSVQAVELSAETPAEPAHESIDSVSSDESTIDPDDESAERPTSVARSTADVENEPRNQRDGNNALTKQEPRRENERARQLEPTLDGDRNRLDDERDRAVEQPDKPEFQGGQFGAGPRFRGGAFEREHSKRRP